jgi:hypothetical protein
MKLTPHRIGLVLNRKKNAGRIATASGFIMRDVESRRAELVAESAATNATTARRVAKLSGFPQVTVVAIT